MRKSIEIFLLLILPLILIMDSCTKENFCMVENISLNEISPYYDGQWQGIIVASDSCCYFGSSAHSMTHGGGFFKYDSRIKEIEILTKDLTDLVGDDITKFTPQGKIHSPIIQIDSKLYLATHLAAYWDEVLDKYAGSYFLSYDIDSEEWNNYGLTKERFSTYSAIEIDAKRGKAYTMMVPFAPTDSAEGKHLYEIDLNTKEKRDLGKLDSGKACFYFFLDDAGRVWISMWQGDGSLYCYDPKSDAIKKYANVFPKPKLVNNESLTTTPFFEGRSWTWLQPIENRKKCLFVMGDFGGGDERLWIFDPNEDIESGKAFKTICDIGNTFLSVALGGDRVYFIQRGSNVNSRNYNTEGMRDEPADINGYHINDLHLKSVSLDSRFGYKIVDHGKLIDKHGRTPAYIGSLAADDKGNVYMSGSWLVKDSDRPTLQYMFKSSDGKAYGPLEHPDQDTVGNNETFDKSDVNFIPLKRGEFFSWVNVSEDLK